MVAVPQCRMASHEMEVIWAEVVVAYCKVNFLEGLMETMKHLGPSGQCHHHHLPPWIRSFHLFRHRRVVVVSWSVHDFLVLGFCIWGCVSAVCCYPFSQGGWSNFVCIWFSFVLLSYPAHYIYIYIHTYIYIYIDTYIQTYIYTYI